VDGGAAYHAGDCDLRTGGRNKNRVPGLQPLWAAAHPAQKEVIQVEFLDNSTSPQVAHGTERSSLGRPPGGIERIQRSRQAAEVVSTRRFDVSDDVHPYGAHARERERDLHLVNLRSEKVLNGFFRVSQSPASQQY